MLLDVQLLEQSVMQKGAKNVADYITRAPKQAQAKLRQMRAIVRTMAPAAEESISYGIPYYSYLGKLLYFGGYEKHIGFYPLTAGMRASVKELERYQTSKGTVQFPLDAPLPVTLIKKLIRIRVRENKAKHKNS